MRPGPLGRRFRRHGKLMPVQSKICGITTPESLDAAVAGGASHVGFAFIAQSTRHIATDQAAALVRRLPAGVTPVALVMDEARDRIEEIRSLTGIKVVQLHGAETPAFAASLGGEIWKAVSVKTQADLSQSRAYTGAVARLLSDAKPPKGGDLPGGTGQRFDWTLLEGYAHSLPWALAGGLDPSNVREAIRVTGAVMVDVSSGVESAPGIKDVDKIAAFLKAASLS